MGVVHIPRTIAAIVRGMTKRRLSPLSDNEKSLVGVGLNNPPHIYSSRAGLFDVDLMFHMNNASYLTHAELARWEWTAFGGTLAESMRSSSPFIVSASFIRFRREVPPLKKFDIETRLVNIDDRHLWVYQTFHHNKGSERGKILAQVFTQGVVTNNGKVINPHLFLEKAMIDAKDALDDLSATSTDFGSIFDEKSDRFLQMEEVLRRSANLYDDKIDN
jgi:acyl-CoA thioesterase FadM